MNKLSVKDYVPSDKCVEFIESKAGIFLSAEDNFRKDKLILKPEAYPFSKWIKQNREGISVTIDTCESLIDLKSEEYWIPIAFLAQDVSFQIFTSALYDYLKFRVRGALQGEVAIVHFSAIFKSDKCYKKLDYSGPVEGLKKFKNIDLNEIMSE